MTPIEDVIKDLIKKNGGNKSEIARKLGGKISSQRLGMYESGKMKPKQDFVKKWKQVFGDDIDLLAERNVSREALPERKLRTPEDLIDDYKAWVNDERTNSAHLRELNLKFVEIIQVLSAKVGVPQNA